MNTTAPTYHIIGAGIAGLACAYELKRGVPNVRTVVYEASDKIGGRAYSYQDKDMGRRLDNATHVVIGANKNMARFINDGEWEKHAYFWDVEQDSLSGQHQRFLAHILKSMCNTPASQIARDVIRKILWLTFPWTRKKRRVYYSKQDLSQKFANFFLGSVDELKLNHKLLKIDSLFGRAAQLNFGSELVEIGPEDMVFAALDNRSYAKLFNEPELPHHPIINIVYQTSQKINLPKAASFVGVINGLSDWIFVNDDILAVTISAADNAQTDLQELARRVWQEIDKLRGVNSAFVPAFKVSCHKHATIAQTEEVNARRPLTAQGRYPNLFIAGDWTMQNYPCCLEAAYLSAKRAVKTALKAKKP
ncbi:MAG: FAD-dependent oxidoreductase [Alphaproteobacteria bacterium]|nr:FAD-dependent oxidoreductase [Alphaproteobacteria bacterium]